LLLAGVGIIGVIMPGWPGTVFLILAAGCFARSAPKLETWLVRHPRFGPPLTAWRESGSISRSIKVMAISSMGGSFLIALLARIPPLWLWPIGLSLLLSAAYVASRPEPPKPMR
jgi:uncharacterized membrane protein YbaN (DUF454 family)